MLFDRISSLNLVSQKQNKMGLASRLHSVVSSEQSQRGRTEIVWSLKTRGNRSDVEKNGIVPDEIVLERSH